ncbi:MAG: DUF1576 domain-containing protein [Cellulosilyticaceae bacterium]
MARIEINKRTRNTLHPILDVKMDSIYKVLLILPIAMFIFAFFWSSPKELLLGIVDIGSAENTLITDYFVVANIGGAFMNASIVMFLNIALLYALKLKPNGIIISALFLLGGFAFMGKNIFNIWPFYLGGLCYSRYHHIPYKNVVVINMLSTALSPLCSFVAQNVGESLALAIILTALVGGFVGFIMPTISAHMLGAHSGYSLYNMGLSTGLLAMVIYGLMSGFGVDAERSAIYYEVYEPMILVFFIMFVIALICVGIYFNGKTMNGYIRVMHHSGRLITDMMKIEGFGVTLINMGLLGGVALIYIYAVGGVLNGPAIAALLTVIGFGAFGKHPKNVVPVIIGVTLGFVFMGQQNRVSMMVITALFGTSLAPISGEYGALWGMLAGMLHAALMMNIGDSHGGMTLYNNGLSAGIIAMLLIPMIDAFKREKHL